MQPLTLSHQHVRLFATAEAALLQPYVAGVWCTTFVALMRAFAVPQQNRAGATLRSIDLATTRWLMRHLKVGRSPGAHDGARHFAELRALCRALVQLRAAGITAEHLHALPRPSPSLAALFADLKLYEEGLAQRNWADTADEQRHGLLRAATGTWPGQLRQLRTVAVEPGVEVFDLRRDLLTVLAAGGLSVCVKLPYSTDNPSTTPYAEAMLHGFEAQGEAPVQLDAAVVHPHSCASSLGNILLQRLTQTHGSEALPPLAVGALTLAAVPPQDPLTQEVVATVHRWLHHGADPLRIAVVLPDRGLGGESDPARLGPHLLRALASEGVPCHMASGPSLIEHPNAQSVVTLLRVSQELDALPQAAAGALFSEEGINLASWASCVMASGAACASGDLILSSGEQANLMRRCGHRRLGPKGLRRALGALRGVNGEVAAATAAAAEQWLQMWALPLMGGLRPLPERLQHVLQFVLHLEAIAPGQDGVGSTLASPWTASAGAVAVALQALGSAAAQFEGLTSLPEAYGWILGVLAEQRQPTQTSGPSHTGVTILSPKDIVGRSFTHVLALGLNNVPADPTTGPLSESLRREINQGLGYKLLQFGGVTGRAPLPQGAQQQFYFYEILRACTQTFRGVVLQLADEEHNAPSSHVQQLMACCAVPLVPVPAAEGRPWHEASTPALRLRQLVAQGGLPWAATQAPHGAEFGALQAGAARMAASLGPSRATLSVGHQALLRAHIEGQVLGVSSLDLLAMCRYRFFAAATLGLSREPHPEHHIDRRRAGEAAHRALHHVYTSLLREAPWAQWCADGAAAQRRAHALFQAHEAVILPTVWVHDDLRAGALAMTWHSVVTQLQRDLQLSHIVPTALEYRFGDPVRSEQEALRIAHPLNSRGPLQVRGTIDRIDVGPGQVDVIDYKSSLPRREPGRHFQLGLYQAVALRDFAGPTKNVAALHATASWQLLGQPSSGPTSRRPPELTGNGQELLSYTFEAVWARMDAFLAGDITPDPAPQSLCKHCDFTKLCRFRAPAEADADAPDPGKDETLS